MELFKRSVRHAELVVLTVSVGRKHIRNRQIRFGNLHIHLRRIGRTRGVIHSAHHPVRTGFRESIAHIAVVTSSDTLCRFIDRPEIILRSGRRVRIESNLQRSAVFRAGDERLAGWSVALVITGRIVLACRSQRSQLHFDCFDAIQRQIHLYASRVQSKCRTDLRIIAKRNWRRSIERRQQDRVHQIARLLRRGVHPCFCVPRECIIR